MRNQADQPISILVITEHKVSITTLFNRLIKIEWDKV